MVQRKRPAKTAARKQPQRVETRFARNPVSLHADGVWGGLTPQRQIVMGFFTEQFAVPEKVTYEIPTVLPGKLRELSRQGGGYVLREIQAQIFISLTTARSLIGWLEERLTQADAIEQQIESLAESGDSDVGIVLIEEAGTE